MHQTSGSTEISEMREQLLAVKREHYRQDLEATLRKVVGALARRPDVLRAILFGSYAEGRSDLFTDLDILIVMDSRLNFVERTAEMYRYLSCPVDLDMLVYTPDEMQRKADSAFIRQVLERGKVIYERGSSG